MGSDPPNLTLAARIAGEDPRRRIVLKLLADEPDSIPGLIKRWPPQAPTQPKIHQQIGHLVEAGCVETTRYDDSAAQREWIYSVTSMGRALLATLR